MNDGNTLPPGNTPGFFGQKISKPGINVNSAGDKDLILKDDYSTRTYYDQSNARMLLGLLPDGSYGLVISKSGVDVTTLFS
jgi:hypothetical protein